MTWKTKTPEQIASVQYNHDRWRVAYDEHQQWQQKMIDVDNARPGKTFMQETHEKFNPGGKAIINSMKGEADG